MEVSWPLQTIDLSFRICEAKRSDFSIDVRFGGPTVPYRGRANGNNDRLPKLDINLLW